MSTGLFHFTVTPDHAGTRIDRFLAEAAEAAGLQLSRTRLQALLAAGHVKSGSGAVAQGKTKVTVGDTLALHVPPPVAAEPAGQPLPLAIMFEDEHLLVLDKPAGLVVHPAAGHDDGTLVNALVAHCGESLSGIGGVRRPGIVHRLDKDTSGLMVVAKNDRSHTGLSEIFADHGRSGSLVREYLAFVWGVPDRSAGMLDTTLGRDPHNRLKMAIVGDTQGRQAVTHWTRERTFGDGAARLRCRLETGRTHQIRVHLTSLGHPLIGDPVYGTGFRTKAARLPPRARELATSLGRQALHAATLGFDHPVTGETLLFAASLPPDLAKLEAALGETG